MNRVTLSLLAATLFVAPVASSPTLPGAAIGGAQTADGGEDAGPSDGDTLETPATVASPDEGPGFAPVVETQPGVNDEPYYGPGWSGPVNHAPAPVCPAWYSPHTPCVPASSPAGAAEPGSSN